MGAKTMLENWKNEVTVECRWTEIKHLFVARWLSGYQSPQITKHCPPSSVDTEAVEHHRTTVVI